MRKGRGFYYQKKHLQYDFNALFLKSTRWIEKISAFVHCFHLLVFSLIISVPFASEFPEHW